MINNEKRDTILKNIKKSSNLKDIKEYKFLDLFIKK